MIDLHSHSTASDGSYSPSALLALAAGRGLKALALTDHDTVAGIPEAEAAAARLGLRLVKGVELELAFHPGEFHLLGLDLARIDGELGAALAGLGGAREERNRRIIGKIREAGIPASMEELESFARAEGGPGAEEAAGPAGPMAPASPSSPASPASPTRIGRPHIASLLVARRAAKNRQDAFDRYLAKGRPFYEAKECLELEEAIRLVKAAGGLAVVAHPLSLFVSFSKLERLMDEWKELGIDGIEAYHPGAKLGECRRVERLARARGFRVTAGSDFHGAIRPDRALGRTAGRLAIGDEYLLELAR